MLIAVDFDGTLVEHRYPEIGRELPFAFETLRMLQKEGHRAGAVERQGRQTAGRGCGFLQGTRGGILCRECKL